MIVLGRSAFWLQDEVRRLRAKSVVGAAEPFRPSDRRTDRARRDTGLRPTGGHVKILGSPLSGTVGVRWTLD